MHCLLVQEVSSAEAVRVAETARRDVPHAGETFIHVNGRKMRTVHAPTRIASTFYFTARRGIATRQRHWQAIFAFAFGLGKVI